jgi:hypothetical protein
MMLVFLCVFGNLWAADPTSDFKFAQEVDGTIVVWAYTGTSTEAVVPATIGGLVVSTIGAFAAPPELTRLVLPASVTSYQPGYRSSEIPIAVNLREVMVDPANDYFVSVDGVVYTKDLETLIWFPEGRVGDFNIPGGVKTVRRQAFRNATGLTHIEIPNGVTTIEWSAFENCSLTHIYIPSSVTNLAGGAFTGCTALREIRVDPSNQAYASAEGVLCDRSLTTVIRCPEGKVGNWVMPDTVQVVSQNAFYHCTKLSTVDFSTNLTTIGSRAFQSCRSLTSATIPPLVRQIDSWTFYLCASLTNVTFMGPLERIGVAAFMYSGLERVTIPSSVTRVENSAFQECPRLATVVIEPQEPEIWYRAFGYCKNLREVYFKGNAPWRNFYSSVFEGVDATYFYLPGTTGWEEWSARYGFTMVLWDPRVAHAGVVSETFGFQIQSSSDLTLIVEFSDGLVGPEWSHLTRVTLQAGESYVIDPHWTDSPQRYYRIRSP